MYCLIGSASFSANIQLYSVKTSHLPFFYVELLFKINLVHEKVLMNHYCLNILKCRKKKLEGTKECKKVHYSTFSMSNYFISWTAVPRQNTGLKNLKTPFFQDMKNSFHRVTKMNLEPHQVFFKFFLTNMVPRGAQFFLHTRWHF